MTDIKDGESSSQDDRDDPDAKCKWSTLEHHAMTFPPPYHPLPKNVKLKTKEGAKVIELSLEAEEMATWWAEVEV
jgi:DNA topoisomerase-1